TDDQAVKLAGIARELRAHVNLIALNPTPLSPNKASAEPGIERFARLLGDLGVNVTVRDTRGKDIDAACGQLRIRSGHRQKDRKSTRLNSSHVKTSYAVFCLKKTHWGR